MRNVMSRAKLSVAVIALGFLMSLPSYGWDPLAPVAGKVGWIQVGASGAVRFTLQGTPPLCNGNNSMGRFVPGYLGMTEVGARNLLSTITAAMLSGKGVAVYSDYDSATNTCSVGTVNLSL